MNARMEYLKKKGMLKIVSLTDDEIARRMVRTSGDDLCPICNKEHRKHPFISNKGALDYNGEPFLHVLCDNGVVKL